MTTDQEDLILRTYGRENDESTENNSFNASISSISSFENNITPKNRNINGNGHVSCSNQKHVSYLFTKCTANGCRNWFNLVENWINENYKIVIEEDRKTLLEIFKQYGQPLGSCIGCDTICTLKEAVINDHEFCFMINLRHLLKNSLTNKSIDIITELNMIGNTIIEYNRDFIASLLPVQLLGSNNKGKKILFNNCKYRYEELKCAEINNHETLNIEPFNVKIDAQHKENINNLGKALINLKTRMYLSYNDKPINPNFLFMSEIIENHILQSIDKKNNLEECLKQIEHFGIKSHQQEGLNLYEDLKNDVCAYENIIRSNHEVLKIALEYKLDVPNMKIGTKNLTLKEIMNMNINDEEYEKIINDLQLPIIRDEYFEGLFKEDMIDFFCNEFQLIYLEGKARYYLPTMVNKNVIYSRMYPNHDIEVELNYSIEGQHNQLLDKMKYTFLNIKDNFIEDLKEIEKEEKRATETEIRRRMFGLGEMFRQQEERERKRSNNGVQEYEEFNGKNNDYDNQQNFNRND